MRYLVLLIGVVSVFSCTTPKTDFQLTGSALGTTYSIQYSGAMARTYKKQLDSIFAAVNQSMSTYIPTSDISRINAGDTTVQVDAMFEEVLRLSKEVHRVSEGAFDPTVGQLVNAYGFGAAQGFKVVDSAKVTQLLKGVGLDKVTLTPEKKIRKTDPSVYLEFNAIAKGYCIDRIGVFLEQQGIEHYLIELGGELLAKGQNVVKQKDWVVGIDDPTELEQRVITTTMRLKDRAMATSGNYRKFRIDPETGNKYVHSIDPLTGYPKLSNVLSVSVLAASCVEADAYATTFMIMDLDETKALLQEHTGLDVYIIFADVDGEIEVFSTQGFEDMLL